MLIKLESHIGHDRGRISHVTCDLNRIASQLAFARQRMTAWMEQPRMGNGDGANMTALYREVLRVNRGSTADMGDVRMIM